MGASSSIQRKNNLQVPLFKSNSHNNPNNPQDNSSTEIVLSPTGKQRRDTPFPFSQPKKRSHLECILYSISDTIMIDY
mgnify:CR=1 FL=1